MNTSAKSGGEIWDERVIAAEASEWLFCLRGLIWEPPEDPLRNPVIRAFWEWLRLSPMHKRIFMEYMHVELRIDALSEAAGDSIRRRIQIERSVTLRLWWLPLLTFMRIRRWVSSYMRRRG